MAIPEADGVPVRQQSQPAKRMKQHGLFDLAGHHRLSNSRSAKESNRPAEAAQRSPFVMMADVREFGRSHIANADAINIVSLIARGLRKFEGKAASASEQPDTLRSSRSRLGRCG